MEEGTQSCVDIVVGSIGIGIVVVVILLLWGIVGEVLLFYC